MAQLDNFVFDRYDQPRITGAFDVNGVPTDPTTVKFSIQDPDGTITNYTYGTDAQVIKLSTGVYYVDWIFNKSGLWTYRWLGTGTVQAATKNVSVTIRPDVFP